MQKGNNLPNIAKKIGVPNLDTDLLLVALTHSSYANLKGLESYERLEFLGDSVLSLIITNYIFRNFNKNEGELTKLRASIVCEESLSVATKSLGIANDIRALDSTHKASSTASILCDVFESVLGAIYLQFGYELAEKWVLEKLDDNIKLSLKGKLYKDYKTKLQELTQSVGKSTTYKIIDEKGDAHDKIFIAQAYIDNDAMGKGEGTSKKQAEQDAAKNTLKALGEV